MWPDGFYPDGFSRLITYYPVWYRDIREMIAILNCGGGMLDDLDAAGTLVLNNCFVGTADSITLSRIEAFMGISQDPLRADDERRRLIKSYLIGFGKVSASGINKMIKNYSGTDSWITFDDRLLLIIIDRGSNSALSVADINAMLRKKIPAHIAWKTGIRYVFAVNASMRKLHSVNEYLPCGIAYAGEGGEL